MSGRRKAQFHHLGASVGVPFKRKVTKATTRATEQKLGNRPRENKGGCKVGRKGESPIGGCKVGKSNPTRLAKKVARMAASKALIRTAANRKMRFPYKKK